MIPLKLKSVGDPGQSPTSMFFEISKNPGIGLLSLDATEEHLQLFHNVGTLGGSWIQHETKLFALSGFGSTSTAIQISEKAIKEVKCRAPKLSSLLDHFRDSRPITEAKCAKDSFHYKNILPIPICLVRSFLALDKFDPETVAVAFYQTLSDLDNTPSDDTTSNNPTTITTPPFSTTQDEQEETISSSPENDDTHTPKMTSNQSKDTILPCKQSFLQDFGYVLQFLSLCLRGKITPLYYTISSNPEILSWQQHLDKSFLLPPRHLGISQSSATSLRSMDDDIDSIASSSSLKDRHVIQTLLKISDTMDQNSLKASEDREKKDPGFQKLDNHRQLLILNASASEPFDDKATSPTPFYRDFLVKKTQFKAREMLLHRLNQENILFLPSAAFAGHLYNANWLWPTPANPSGISIFFSPEPTSASITTDPDRGLALLDKVERADISKLTKEKFEFPSSVINAIFMLQNFRAIIALCFGENSNSALCVKNWVSHMMKHRQMYHSCQESDHTFLSQVFFAIDRALQIHWRSCADNSTGSNVNDRILFMDDSQSNIEHHNFSHLLPTVLLSRIPNPNNKQGGRGGDGKYKNGRKNDGKDDNNNGKKQRVTDDHNHWHIKDGEDFSDLFYNNKNKCPKTEDGTLICMKLFIRGFCDQSFTRAHKLSKDKEKEFEIFLTHCRRKDFPQGAGGVPP